MRVAVVGHVEWVDFIRVDQLPAPGEIIHARDTWAEPAGGGGVAAVVLAALAGECLLVTALGDDALGHRSAEDLRGLGVRVEAVYRPEPQRRAVTHVDDTGERTITLLSHKLIPYGTDPLPWDELATMDAIYFTGGDPDALRAARAARTLVATARELPTLVEASVRLDALVRSGRDPGETYEEGWLDPPPRIAVATESSAGGLVTEDGEEHRFAAATLPGPVSDMYGAGDSFAAGLTFGLGSGLAAAGALELGARCAALALTRRGAYGGPLVP